jgi:transposase InsO family protein
LPPPTRRHVAHVRSAFALSNGTYGSPRMARELRDSGLTVGRRRTARLMRENGLRARQKRRFKRITDSHHAWPVAPNLLDKDFTATGPDEKWGDDISYVWTREGWLYLAVVIDLFARRVVGWATGDRLHRDLALAALRKALAMRRPAAGLIHHSDSKTVRAVPGRLDPHSDRPLGGLVLQGASGWPDPHSDRPRACLSADLSAAQEHLAERLRLAGACDPRRA